KILYVKQKTGYLSYLEYPKGGNKNTLLPAFTSRTTKLENSQENFCPLLPNVDSSNSMLTFAKYFCCSDPNPATLSNDDFYTKLLYECLSEEKTEMVPTYFSLHELGKQLEHKANPITLGNTLLILEYYK